MTKSEKEDFKILQTIFKNAQSKKQDCLVCSEKAINSHVLQKNGILNLISSNNHVTQIKAKDFFAADKNGIMDVKSIGINNAMSYSLFCNFHDTNIFAPIEKSELNLENYNSQLLFSYRALCAELRKKIINVDIFERILNANHFSVRYEMLDMARSQLEGTKLGIEDLEWYKTNFEMEINNIEMQENFMFEKIDFDFIPVSVSAAYSPINPSIHSIEELKSREKTLNYIFINLIPQYNKLSLIIGYHRDKCDSWIIDYINSWKNISQKEFELKLTDLLATKVETWAISPEYYSNLSQANIKTFIKYWNSHASDLRVTQKVDFNLFG